MYTAVIPYNYTEMSFQVAVPIKQILCDIGLA